MAITPEYLLECFDFDADKGVLTWKNRPVEHFPSVSSWHSWTRRAAGLRAGNYRPDGYIRITLDGARYYAHRIIFAISRLINLENVPSEIDHVDFDKTNNRPDNLREATRSQNLMNTTLRSDNTSGFKGVGWDRRALKWVARIKVNGKVVASKLFSDPAEAGAWREKAANELHGEFARHAVVGEAA